jgi:hypothetical protein
MSKRIRVTFTIADDERSLLLNVLEKARSRESMPYVTNVIDAAIDAVRDARNAAPVVNLNAPWEAPHV